MSRPPDASAPHRSFYAGRRVLVTGGLGFIGSNLARQLVELGARVTIVDALIPDYGGNRFNIDGIEDRARVEQIDVRDAAAMAATVREPGCHLQSRGAGEPHRQHAGPAHRPRRSTAEAQLTLLEACRAHNPGAKVVYAGTRQVYGQPDSACRSPRTIS